MQIDQQKHPEIKYDPGWCRTCNIEVNKIIRMAPNALAPSVSRTSAHMITSVSGLNLGLCPANERRRYDVTLSLIGWAQTEN